MRWCSAANPRRAAAAQAHCATADAYSTPRRRVLCYFRFEPALESPRRQTLLHMSTQSHKRKAAAVVIDTEALVCRCSGSRCSSP